MQPSSSAITPTYLRNSLLFGVLVALALLMTGRLLVPATSFTSTMAASAILLAYGGMAALCPLPLYRLHAGILRWGLIFGLLAGAVFSGEIILEYILLPADNSRYRMVEFGTVFLLYLAAGFTSATATRSVKNAIFTSLASAFIGSIIWTITVLGVFYTFRGSPRQALVLRAEGDYEDFARSGMKNFDAFIMEDFMGAIFFHLLLGLIIAVVLGLIAGLAGKAIGKAKMEPQESGQHPSR